MHRDPNNQRYDKGTFASDQETERIIRYAISLCKFRNYVGGFKHLQTYLAVIAFERMMRLTGEKYGYTSKNEDDAVNKTITGLYNPNNPKKNKISQIERKDLKSWWGFRNDIVHPFSRRETQKMDDESAIDDTQKLLKFICERIETDTLDYQRAWDESDLEDISLFGKSRPAGPARYERITSSDFEEFDRLYDKCYGFQNEVGSKLKNRMLPEEITGFTLNTGAIWVPWAKEKLPQILHKRTRTYKATLGVVFSPCNIRMGLEFGAKAYASKEKYYRLLLENKIDREIEALIDSHKGYKLYDTYWYYYLKPEARQLEWSLNIDPSKKALIQGTIDEVHDSRLQNKTMTANSLLICKVVDRDKDPNGFTRTLDNLPEEVSDTIDRIYPVLDKIESL